MKGNPLKIKAYLHCRTCFGSDQPEKLEVGVSDLDTLEINCTTCNQRVASFALDDPPELHCDVCDEPIGPEHKH
jgi:hypothetical protein